MKIFTRINQYSMLSKRCSYANSFVGLILSPLLMLIGVVSIPSQLLRVDKFLYLDSGNQGMKNVLSRIIRESRNTVSNNSQGIMAVKQYSKILLQITNFNQLRTGFRLIDRHECLPADH